MARRAKHGGGRTAGSVYRESDNGSDWAASLNQQSFNDRKRSGNAQLAASGFHKSYAGRPASGEVPRMRRGRQTRQPRSNSTSMSTVRPLMPESEVPPAATSWRQAGTMWSPRRAKTRDCALARSQCYLMCEAASTDIPILVELSRAVHENKGFLPAVWCECAQDGRVVPAKSVVADSRVPCKAAVLGVYGKDEVWTI